MTLIRWNNKQPISIFDDFDNIFNNMHFGLHSIEQNQSSWNPQFEVLNTDKAYIVRGDLPGVSKKDINIEVNDNILTILGERRNDNRKGDNSFDYSRIYYGKFSKSFNLPDDVEQDKIQASMKNGVLSLEIPRIKIVKNDVKKIAIK